MKRFTYNTLKKIGRGSIPLADLTPQEKHVVLRGLGRAGHPVDIVNRLCSLNEAGQKLVDDYDPGDEDLAVKARIAGYCAFLNLPEGSEPADLLIDFEEAEEAEEACYDAWLKSEGVEPAADLRAASELGFYDAYEHQTI